MSVITLRADPAEALAPEMAERLVEQTSANQPLEPARKTGDVILNVDGEENLWSARPAQGTATNKIAPKAKGSRFTGRFYRAKLCG